MRVSMPVLALLLIGCSAGRASVALVQADKAISHAKNRGAAEQAEFELAMAEAYLTKAREEAHFSSYRESVELSRGAADWADRAVIVMESEGTASASSAPNAPGGVTAPKPLPSQPPDAPAAPPADAQSPGATGESPDAWTQRDPTESDTDTDTDADTTGEPADSEDAEPRKLIVVPVPESSDPPPPKLIIVPRDDTVDEEETP